MKLEIKLRSNKNFIYRTGSRICIKFDDFGDITDYKHILDSIAATLTDMRKRMEVNGRMLFLSSNSAFKIRRFFVWSDGSTFSGSYWWEEWVAENFEEIYNTVCDLHSRVVTISENCATLDAGEIELFMLENFTVFHISLTPEDCIPSNYKSYENLYGGVIAAAEVVRKAVAAGEITQTFLLSFVRKRGKGLRYLAELDIEKFVVPCAVYASKEAYAIATYEEVNGKCPDAIKDYVDWDSVFDDLRYGRKIVEVGSKIYAYN